MSLPLNKLLSGYTISDEVINRTSSTAIALAHSTIKSAGLEIWTGAGKTGTKLTLATDYSLSDLNTTYTAEAGENIYTKLAIVNGAYQSMNLYVTYYSVGDFAAVEKIGQAAMETINVTASFTLYASAPTTRKRIVNTGASAITVTFSGFTCNGVTYLPLTLGCAVDIEMITAATAIIVGTHGFEYDLNYTRLISAKIITGISGSSAGASVSINHGLSSDKIVSMTGGVYLANGSHIPFGFITGGGSRVAHLEIQAGGTTVDVTNDDTLNSAYFDRPVYVRIMYFLN